ncbi:hypothetical protein ABZ714_06645 [Streptomyces sp. NPDC006798]|uniref:hypothetical protein n=1 Tax=Streptomyces sp. NPDC006798 TaxID=3155462 RepID=UPI0033F1ECD3
MHTIHITGAFTITPPIPPESTRGTLYHPETPEEPPYGCDLILRLDTTGHATHLQPRRHHTHALTHQIQHAINTYPHHTITGQLHCHGPQPGTPWHITITNNHPTETHHSTPETP